MDSAKKKAPTKKKAAPKKEKPVAKKKVPKDGRDESGRFVIGNRISVANAGGAPPKYTSPEDLVKEANTYFEYIKGVFHIERQKTWVKVGKSMQEIEQDVKVWDRDPEPPTITGLTLYLGFCDRASFYDYESDRAEFSNAVKACRTAIENKYEQVLYVSGHAGSIFALKNMGWKDKTEVAQTDGEGKPLAAPVINVTVSNGVDPLAGSEEEVRDREGLDEQPDLGQ